MNRHRPVRALSRVLSHSLSSSSSASSETSFPLKHVTRSNFVSALAELRSHVRAADFIAIDLEMTGVTSAPWRESLEFDRSDVRYLKVKDSVEKFAVVQFGVCPFLWDSSKQSFIARPHNFYIFPQQDFSVHGSSYEFLCQTASMEFLAKYQFDFNACIHEGITYLSKRQEDEALIRLNIEYGDKLSATSFDFKENREIPSLNMVDVLFTERMKNRFREWLDRLMKPHSGGFQFQESKSDAKQQFHTFFFKMHPALNLSGFTSRQLKLIKLVIRKHFKDLYYVQVNGENSLPQEVVVYTESKEDKDLLKEEMKNEYQRIEEMKVKDAIGFRHVIDLLSAEQKLIIGHNCFLDLAHIYSKFFGPLPSTAEEFVSSVNKHFPHIIDTKILLNATNILQQCMRKSSTSLASAFASLCPHMALSCKSTALASSSCVDVEIQVDDLRSSNWNSGAKHEAGYDAFMTGCIFAQACSHLGIDFKLHFPSGNLAYSEKLKQHMNLLYLSWSAGDIIDLSTGNTITKSLIPYKNKKWYPKIVFENIVLLWGFPYKLKAREIKECILKVFGSASVISVYHLDETAVFVQFVKAELVSDFLHLKETLEQNDGPISVLHPMAELLDGGNTHAACYETYKEICKSSTSRGLFADQAESFGVKWKTKLPEFKAVSKINPEYECAVPEDSRKVKSEFTYPMEALIMDNFENGSSGSCFTGDKVIYSSFDAEDTHLKTSVL